MPLTKPLTYTTHRARWQNCSLCELCARRKRVVLLRGTVPAKILFIGEAPGESEDVVGQPFVGPAGKLLDQMIAAADIPGDVCAFTNIIACIPHDEAGDKITTPPKYAIEACEDRLDECVRLANPQLIVRVGAEADKNFKGPSQVLNLAILHPAAILRMKMQAGLAKQRTIVALRDAWEEVR